MQVRSLLLLSLGCYGLLLAVARGKPACIVTGLCLVFLEDSSCRGW